MGNGIFTSGTSVGALVAPVLIISLSQRFGWRASFAAVASLGAIWFVVWVLYTRQAHFAPIWTEDRAARRPVAVAYKEVLSNPQFWRVFAVTILVNPCLYFLLNWLPTYFVQARGLTLGTAEMIWILTLIFIGLDLGYLSCGLGVLGLTRAGLSIAGARAAVFCAATVLLSGIAAVPYIASLNTAVAVLVVVLFAIGVWISMYLTMAQEVSPAHVSTAAGLLGGSGSLAGALAMWAVGAVTQRTGSFAAPMIAVAVAGVMAAGAGIAVTRHRSIS
jgi:ACS family hexuronate transporter-like MFS transporter